MTFFAILNVLMVYLFAPAYGEQIYHSKTVIANAWGPFYLTKEELFYLFNLSLKYFSTVPLALLFLLTTNPSQFASSLNQIGLPYKVAYAVSLTLRYIPDVQEEFYMIKTSQEARGLELSKKAKLFDRIKGNLQIIIPLIFSSLDRIDLVATAMELRRFGKNKRRTWYTSKQLDKNDIMTIFLAIAILLTSFILFVINKGRFYNPFTQKG